MMASPIWSGRSIDGHLAKAAIRILTFGIEIFRFCLLRGQFLGVYQMGDV
jgi:hypothetical protein